MDHYLFALLFFLPAGVANTTPPIANIVPLLNRWRTPLDFGIRVGGKPMFGKNKTWRGLVVGTLVGGLIGWLLFPFITTGDGDAFAHFLIGSSLGFGALLGDAIESFFKRQRGIPSGKSWLGFDQLDYVVGAIIFSFPFVRLDIGQYLAVLVSYFVLHFVVSYIGFRLHIKENPFKL